MKQICAKRFLAVMLASTLFFSGIMGIGIDAQAETIATVKINKSTVTLVEGKKVALKIKKSKVKKITSIAWTSKNKKIATVSKKGQVTAETKGKAKIKCVVKYQTKTSPKTLTKTLTCTVKVVSKDKKMKKLGGMSPKAALQYMKKTKNLVIVDVATSDWYEQEHFEGAIHIPIEELSSSEADALYMKIPEGKPVLVHCRLGMIAPDAYKRIIKLRPDIPEISYIDGKPPFKEYNEWLKKN